jgi:hypothetical protein
MSLIKINQAVLDQLAKDARMAELKQLLADTDYVGLSDYDKPADELKVQRQAWRDEIRELETEEEIVPEVEEEVSTLEGEDDGD